MYRKYHSSTKSSRHERLAQLSEQESVIEKKKREILAKLEAQKKKETEAFIKFEPSNIGFTRGKKDNAQHFKKHSETWEKNVEDEEPKGACHKNAFSNDGSFLDQFKKMSSTLSQKNVDLLALPKIMKSKQGLDYDKTLEKDHKKSKKKCVDYDRSAYDVDVDIGKPVKQIQNSNVQNQLPQPGWVQLISSHHHLTVPHCSKLNDKVLKFTTTVPQSKPVSSEVTLKSPNATKYRDETMDVSLSPSRISVVPVEENVPITEPHSMRPGSSFQARELTTTIKTRPDLRCKRYTDEEFSTINITENIILDADRKSEELWTQIHSDQMSRSSISSDKISRVSPALTDDEEENRNEEHLKNAVGQDERRTYSSVQSASSSGSSPEKGEQEGLNSRSEKTIGDIDVEERANRRERKEQGLECDSTDSDSNSKDSYHSTIKRLAEYPEGKSKYIATSDSYKTDCDDESSYSKLCYQNHKKLLIQESSKKSTFPSCKDRMENPDGCGALGGKDSSSGEKRKRKKKSRWGDEVIQSNSAHIAANSDIFTVCSGTGGKTPMLSKLTRSDPGLIQYARQTFGSTNLSEEDWKKAEDHYKINLLYQDMVKKRAEIERLEKAGKFKYEYDSDEDVEGGTWEHKLRQQEMMATQLWAEELTRQAAGKHHIGDFLPPEELERFMEKYNAVKQGRNPDLSDYKEFKLKEDNVGYRLLQKMGWNEGQGLGQGGTGITNPVNKASTRHENQGLGIDRPDGLQAGDDEYDAYRKRMMLAYRFRPNPLNNPRRPYY